MNKITERIRRQQIAAFFILTFGITWGLGFTYDAVMNRGMDLLIPLAFVATCGPALAGIIVTRICNAEPKSGSTKTPRIAFLIALVISTLVFLIHNTTVNHAPLSPVMVVFILISSAPVAYIISAAASRVPAVRRYLSTLVNARQVWGWILLAFVVTIGLNVLSTVISNGLGRQSVQLSDLHFIGLTLLKMFTITFFYQLFFFNGTGEEVGWRGFALPRLQAYTSPLIASLVLTFFWALWHAVFWQAGGDPVFTGKFWLDTFVKLFPATVMINWFYNRSKGSILVAGVTHAAANTVFEYMPSIDWPIYNATLYAFVLVIILIDQMWKKLPSDHPATIQSVKNLHLKNDLFSGGS
jgi:membrane protease YdiL (CAAX protease family)